MKKPDHCHGVRLYPPQCGPSRGLERGEGQVGDVYHDGVPTAPLYLTIPLAVLLLALAVASGVMARGGFSGTLARTGRLGVHTPPAMASDEAFRVANRVAAPVTAGAGVVTGVVGVLILTLPLTAMGTVFFFLLGLVGGIVLLVIAGLMGDRAARHVPIPARKPTPAAGSACSGCACGSGGCAGLTRSDPAAATGQA